MKYIDLSLHWQEVAEAMELAYFRQAHKELCRDNGIAFNPEEVTPEDPAVQDELYCSDYEIKKDSITGLEKLMWVGRRGDV
jgi:hypothetical protein